MEHLTELILEWGSSKLPDDSMKEREILGALEPHRKLKELKIRGYGGTIFPDWVAHQSFSDMVEVSLYGYKNCCLLPPLGQLPSLKSLVIGKMDGLESIGDEICGTSLTNPFPSLEALYINFVHSLERWSFTRVGQEAELFPRLKSITLHFCGKLKVGLPAGLFPSLEVISIRFCTEMVSVLPISQGEVDSAYPSLKLIKLFGCPRLESFSGMGLPSNLKKLNIRDCPMLTANRMKWDLQRLSSFQSLALRDFEVVVGSFPEEGLLPSTLTSFKIEHCRIKALNGKGLQHLTSLQQFKIWYCEELECLPEEGLPLSLTFLMIYSCPLLKERCQRGTGEDWPKIQHIPNIEMDRMKI